MAVVLEMCIDSLAARSVNTLPTSAGYGSDVGLRALTEFFLTKGGKAGKWDLRRIMEV